MFGRALAKVGVSLALLLPLAAAASSCIRKRPPAEPALSAAPAAPPAATTANAPTGKWGQVKGESLAPAEGLRAFQVHGKTERVVSSFVKVEGQPFEEAVHVEIREASGNPWDVQLQARIAKPVNTGDVMLATFYFRSLASKAESAEGQTEFVTELAREPWTKSVSSPARAGHDWKQVFVRFTAAQAYGANEAQMIFRLGYPPEVIEIGGFSLENFGKELALADLPTTKITYPGMEADAPWRAAAAERIEKIRKAELSITVTDRAKKPLPGADVVVKQTRQAFGFGSAVQAQRLVLPGNGNERYQALIPELFNIAVLENNLKWQPLAGDWGSGWTLDMAKQGVDWLSRRGIPTRGHVLVWPGWKNLPRSLRDLEKDPPKLREAVRRHVHDMVSEMKGKLVHWDVVNEPFDNHDLLDRFGNEVMLEWFKEARATDPGVKLFINDYAILSGGGADTPHRDHYAKTIGFLVEKGAPFDGVGMQGHFGSSLTSPDDMLKILDRFAKYGKTIWVTEYDVDIPDEELAGRFTRDFYTTLFSHPAVAGILMWGFWDAAHWHRNAPLYREDWSLKPAGQAYRELVLGAFRTNVNGKSDAAGVYRTRAFLGSYEVTVSAGGKSKTVKLEVTPGAPAASIALD